MKKFLAIGLCLLLCSGVFAVDYARVVRNGVLVKTQNPVFSSVTVTTLNYNVVGTVTASVGVMTTANISNLGKALNTQGFAITGGSAYTAGTITGTAVTASTSLYTPAATITTASVTYYGAINASTMVGTSVTASVGVYAPLATITTASITSITLPIAAASCTAITSANLDALALNKTVTLNINGTNYQIFCK